jgi:hypothetical protein
MYRRVVFFTLGGEVRAEGLVPLGEGAARHENKSRFAVPGLGAWRLAKEQKSTLSLAK